MAKKGMQYHHQSVIIIAHDRSPRAYNLHTIQLMRIMDGYLVELLTTYLKKSKSFLM